jgi:hypothetical protein
MRTLTNTVELGRVKKNEGGALTTPISDANTDRYIRFATSSSITSVAPPPMDCKRA